ncbi:hypothetical protein C3E98_019610 [Pseudomonas sp. MWU13-2625]|nr:hypothetical protein C3E98_019610 [Pseudomonas sp. MWU13-2625]
MTSSVLFATAYRLLGRPKLQTRSSFSFRADSYSQELAPAIATLRASQVGRFDEILVDGKEIQSVDFEVPDKWSTFEFVYKLGGGEIGVYKNFQQLLIECKAIVRGVVPKELYLIDEDICSQGDAVSDPRLDNLNSLCDLIVCLADLAHYHDEKLRGEEYRLIFVEEDGARGAKTITLQPNIDLELLQYNVSSLLLGALLESNFEKNPHIVKERSIFRASLVEFFAEVSDSRERFKFLVVSWKEFLRLYNNNLDTYLSGFSFHKAKQEVGTAELSIADQLSKLISDISGKILSIPISLVVLVAIAKADNGFESAILVLGVAITSFIMAETIAAQKLQYNRISHSRRLLFSAHEKKIEIYPDDLKEYLRSAVRGLVRNEKMLGRSLVALRCLVWIPAVSAAALHGFIYKVELVDGWGQIASMVGSLLSALRCC